MSTHADFSRSAGLLTSLSCSQCLRLLDCSHVGQMAPPVPITLCLSCVIVDG